jgi:hypothetical protein
MRFKVIRAPWDVQWMLLLVSEYKAVFLLFLDLYKAATSIDLSRKLITSSRRTSHESTVLFITSAFIGRGLHTAVVYLTI